MCAPFCGLPEIPVESETEMRRHLTFDAKIETKKAYLTRMARLLNVIRNHPEQINEYPQISGMTLEEEKEFENYLCEVIRSDVEKAAKLAARRSKIEDYTDVIINNALISTMQVIHTYNDPVMITAEDGYSFEVFISNLIRNSVREAFIEKTGLKKHQIDKVNRVRKTMNYIVTTTQKSYEDVMPEDIFESQGQISNAKPLSVESIKDILEYSATQVYMDGLENFEIELKEHLFVGIENDETKKMLHNMFGDMRKAQQYIFLKKFASGNERITYKQLAKETKLIELCMEDEVCMRNLTRGSLTILRPKGQAPQIEEHYTDIIYLKVDFIDYLYRDALKRLKKFVIENEIIPSDLEGWIEDWIAEELNNL